MYINDTVHQKLTWCKRKEKCNDTCLTMAEGTIDKIFSIPGGIGTYELCNTFRIF